MLNHLVSNEIEAYCSNHSQTESEVFQELAKETYQKMEVPQMQVGNLEGSFLRQMVQVTRAQQVLEIGTFTGYSALCMAEGLPDNGRLITCDIDPEATSLAQKYWSKSPHGKKISLKLGSALETLKDLPGPFDLVFIDADKENYISYWEAVLPKVRKGGVILADNVLWSGQVLNPQDSDGRAIVNFNKHVKNDKRVDAVILTIRDGITFATVK